MFVFYKEASKPNLTLQNPTQPNRERQCLETFSSCTFDNVHLLAWIFIWAAGSCQGKQISRRDADKIYLQS